MASYSMVLPIDGVSHRTTPYGAATACGVVIAGRTAGRIPAATACEECARVSLAAAERRAMGRPDSIRRLFAFQKARRAAQDAARQNGGAAW